MSGAGLAVPADASDARRLSDCVAELNARGGGWCELPGTIADVWPVELTSEQRGAAGPATVLEGWNGAAWDMGSLKVYFHGGGPGDYGGNEVYEFDLASGVWSRLTDPAPYPPVEPGVSAPEGADCAPPLEGPPASRHFDAIVFSSRTRTIWSTPVRLYCWRGRRRAVPEVWEFNPSRTQERNGMASLTWRRHTTLTGAGALAMAERKDGSVYWEAHGRIRTFDPRSARFTRRGGNLGDVGATAAAFDAKRGIVWVVSRLGLFRVAGGTVQRRSPLPAGLLPGSGIAVNRDGLLVFWDGRRFIHSYDPDRDEWRLHEWREVPDAGPIGRVFGKWAYLPDYDVFAGINSHRTGVWLYKHPGNAHGIAVNRTPIQRYIDRAPTGAVVTVPAGVYPAGAKIVKPVTLRLKGVRILGNTARKAIVNVRINGGPVVIEDLTATDGWGCSTGNCAGVKVEGIDFDVTLRRVHIANQIMGVLTDNRGGRLVIEDSLIEEQGHPHGALSHLVYGGRIAKLVIRNSTLRRSRHLGHLLKSRARETFVEGSRLLGLDGNHSRSIDLPCGGRLVVRDSVIQHGGWSDNADLFAIGTEPQNCGAVVHPAAVEMTNNWIISDRGGTAFDRTSASAPSTMFTWRATGDDRLVMTGNRIVNIGSWSGRSSSWRVPDLSAGNRLIASRPAAGLGPSQIPAPEARR